MSPQRSGPPIVIVPDVVTLVDAVEAQGRRKRNAINALEGDPRDDVPVYFSETVLKTTANKLIHKGADPKVVREYIDFLTEEDEYGPDKNVLEAEDVPVRDYGLRDKYGNTDHEDSTVVSLLDAAARDSGRVPVLVSRDGELLDWCQSKDRPAFHPENVRTMIGNGSDEIRRGTYTYLGDRMFDDPRPLPDGKATRRQAAAIVADSRAQRPISERYPYQFLDQEQGSERQFGG